MRAKKSYALAMCSHVFEDNKVLDLYAKNIYGSLIFLENFYNAIEGFSLLLFEHPDTWFSEGWLGHLIRMIASVYRKISRKTYYGSMIQNRVIDFRHCLPSKWWGRDSNPAACGDISSFSLLLTLTSRAKIFKKKL